MSHFRLSKAEKEVLNDRLSSVTEGIRTMADRESKGNGDVPRAGGSKDGDLGVAGAAAAQTLQGWIMF